MEEVTFLGMSMPGLIARVATLGVAALVAAGLSHVVTRALRRALERTNVPSASIFVNLARALVWAFALLAVLQPVFGIAPTAFVTALGVTSLVISFGMQDTVSNVIGGLGLMAGKVVQPGDFVEVSGFKGEVVDVNWRSTTVRDRLGNEQVIPNSVLNKTALTRRAAASGSLCEMSVLVAHGIDLDAVRADILSAVSEMTDLLRADCEAYARFVGSDAYRNPMRDWSLLSRWRGSYAGRGRPDESHLRLRLDRARRLEACFPRYRCVTTQKPASRGVDASQGLRMKEGLPSSWWTGAPCTRSGGLENGYSTERVKSVPLSDSMSKSPFEPSQVRSWLKPPSASSTS